MKKETVILQEINCVHRTVTFVYSNGKKQCYNLEDTVKGELREVAYLKADLAKLGYLNVKFTDLEQILIAITKTKPQVEIQSDTNRVYLISMLEHSNIG